MNHRLKYETIVALALIVSCFTGCAGQERIVYSATEPIGFGRELSLPWSMDEPSGGSSREAAPGTETITEESADEEAHEGGPLIRHELSVFGGATSHGSKHGGTVGGEYEYRFTEKIGIAGQAEWTGGDFDGVWLFDGGLTFRPVEPLRFMAGVGWVREKGGEELLLGRIGTLYAFHLAGHYFLAPTVNVDFIEGGTTETVYGLNVGWGF